MSHRVEVLPCQARDIENNQLRHPGLFYFSCSCGVVSQCWDDQELAEKMALEHRRHHDRTT